MSKTFYKINIDSNEVVIKNDDFSESINKLMDDKSNGINDFEVEIINQDNVIDKELNVITNYYINELVKDNNTDYSSLIEKFIINSIIVLNRKRTPVFMYGDDHIVFELFRGYDYFRVIANRDVISKAKYNEFLALGPDDLVNTDLMNLDELLPSFYSFLYENDAFNNSKLNDLSKYKIGLW